jgi:hypothetical protein
VKGEPLRRKKNPSVTELLIKRIRQTEGIEDAVALAEALRQWDPKAAVPLLKELTIRTQEEKLPHLVLRLTQARLDLADPRAFTEYLDWLPRLTPEMLVGFQRPADFMSLMGMSPENPDVVRTAALLFRKDASLWLPLVPRGKRSQDAPGSLGLLESPLLAVAPFRAVVLDELRDRRRGGTFSIPRERSCVETELLDGSTGSHHDSYHAEVPAGGMKGTFRICDFVAWQIALAFSSAPRCELYWPVEKRDDAVKACRAFLEQYGKQLRDRGEIEFPSSARPATAERVRKGLAIFSLEEEGAKTRVVPMKFPTVAVWKTLQDRPIQVERRDGKGGPFMPVREYRQEGQVWQAEEVFKDGAWQRYFGFAGVNRLARVPAADIEFLDRERSWMRAGKGFGARLELDTSTASLESGMVSSYPVKVPVRAAIRLRNSRGLDLKPLALGDAFRLRLHYSPGKVSAKGEFVSAADWAEEWAELPARPDATWPAGTVGSLGPAEEATPATVDLRRFFDLSRPGFYRIILTVPGKDPIAWEEVSQVPFAIFREPSR